MKILRLIFIILLIAIISYSAKSSESYEKYINSNFGTDFWFTVPPALIENGSTNNNFVTMYINSDFDTKVSINIAGKGYTQSFLISKGIAKEISLEPHLAQVYVKTALDPVFESEIYKNSAINIKSDAPITVHTIVKYTSTGEGFVVLPTNVLGNEYIVSSYGDASVYYPVYNSFPSLSGIVAAYDGTEVNFTLGGNQQTKTSSGQLPGQTIKKILNRGDVWMISSSGRDADLSGSKVVSDKPVAVISGNHAANIPSANKYAGYIAEMEIPTYSWGKTYHIPYIYGRKFSPILRVFSKETDTKIYIDGALYTTIPNSGGIKNDGYVEIRLSELLTNKFATITADKPIAITLYNTGVEEDGLPEPPGDPLQISLTSQELYINEMYFSMPAIAVEQSYRNNYLNLIFKNNGSATIPDNLLLGKFKNTTYEFKQIDKNSIIEIVNYPSSDYSLAIIKIDATGKFAIKSDSKFAVYMYGFNNNSAYGFPAGLKVQSLNSKDSESPKSSWEIDCKGVVRGSTIDMPEDDSQNSKLAGSLFLSDESYNFAKGDFQAINPGITKHIDWELKVIDQYADAKAALIFWDAAGNFSKSEIYYQANKVDFINKYEHFGSFKLYTETESRKFKIVNLSDSIFKLDKVELKDKNSGFTLKLPDLPVELKKDEEYIFDCIFTPNKIGILADSIGFGDECNFLFASHVEAVVGSPVIEVSDISFGDVTNLSQVTTYSKIKNTGVSELILSGYTNSNEEIFSIEFERKFDKSNPLILYPGEETTMAVTFSPLEIGNLADSIVIRSDASTRDSVCYIRARSVAPGLVAGSFDWGRKRIFRTNFPEGPYPILNENGSISINNTGNIDIIINGVDLEGSENSSAFEFNRQLFTNLKIAPGEKFDYKVQFRPIEKGEHFLKIKYKNNFGSTTTTELRGFGSVPKIASQIIEFDTVVVEDYDNISIRKINIKNLSIDDWEFADTITIYDLISRSSDDISEVWAAYGDKGYKIDKLAINFPLKLAPGHSHILYSGFVPISEGLSESELLIISDGIDTASIKLVGHGIEQALSFIGGSGESCIGFSNIITGTVKNNSPDEIKIASVNIIKPEPEFTILDTDIQQGFSLNPGESRNISILYKPVNTADKEIEVVLVDAKIPILKKQATFKGKPIQYITDAQLNPPFQTAEIGDTVTLKFQFNTNYDLTNLNFKNTIVKIKYDDYILLPIENSMIIGSSLEGSFSISKDLSQSKAGLLCYKINSIAGVEITKDSDLFELSFLIYYPNDRSNTSDITFSILPTENDCIVVNNSKSRINLNPICADEIRVINFSDSKYYLSSVNPSPIQANSFEIKFGIGIDAQTEMTIMNNLGEKVANPINSFMTKGQYTAVIDASEFSSGVYYYILKSGPFVSKEKFIISK